MDKLSLSKGHDVRRQKCKNCGNDGNNSLLCSFIEYVWDENNGECKADELTRWLKPKNEILWYCLSGSDVKSNEDVLRKARESIDERMCSKLAFKLKKVLSILIDSNDDVNYLNDNSQTFLHIFMEKCLKNTEIFSQHQIFKLQKLIYYLVKRKAPFFTSNEHDDSPLHIAKSCKNQEVPKIVISTLIDLDACDGFENTALRFVVDNSVDHEGNWKNDYMDYAKKIISKGANINARNSDGVSAVHLAAKNFQADVLKLFASQGIKLDERTNDDQTPLHFACKSTLNDSPKAMETFDFLVAQGCNIEAVDKNGWTPLHFAAEFRSAEFVEKLIAVGASIDCRTKETLLTPLYLAAKRRNVDNVEALIKAGADVNDEAADGSTPLFASVILVSRECVQFLIDQGTDLHRRDRVLGLTLLHVVAYDADQTDYSKLDAIIDAGFDVNDPSMCGISPLQVATLHQNLEHVKILVDRGADVNFQNDKMDLTALHLAAIWSHLDIMKVLLENGADFERRAGVDRMTPLHMVLAKEVDLRLGKYPAGDRFYGYTSYLRRSWSFERVDSIWIRDTLIALLLEHGADVNVKDAAGQTPLHLAMRRRDWSSMRILLEAGARVNVQDNEGRLPIHNVCDDDWSEEFELLLNFGADVNDDDTSELIANEICISRTVAIKRKLIGLPLARGYEFSVDSCIFREFYEECSKEAASLKNYRDEDGFSLYEFLRMKPNFQYHYVDKITSWYGNLEETFPMYAGLIRGACREAVVRRELLELAEIAWTKIFGALLPDLCMDKIFGLLSNRYLDTFVESASGVQIIRGDDGAESVIAGLIKSADWPKPYYRTIEEFELDNDNYRTNSQAYLFGSIEIISDSDG